MAVVENEEEYEDLETPGRVVAVFEIADGVVLYEEVDGPSLDEMGGTPDDPTIFSMPEADFEESFKKRGTAGWRVNDVVNESYIVTPAGTHTLAELEAARDAAHSRVDTILEGDDAALAHALVDERFAAHVEAYGHKATKTAAEGSWEFDIVNGVWTYGLPGTEAAVTVEKLEPNELEALVPGGEYVWTIDGPAEGDPDADWGTIDEGEAGTLEKAQADAAAAFDGLYSRGKI